MRPRIPCARRRHARELQSDRLLGRSVRADAAVERCRARHRMADSEGHHADRLREGCGRTSAPQRPLLRMKVIITGAKGQLGLALQRHAPRGMDVIPYARADLDIADARAVEFALVGADALINAAAYTDVESAELNAADAFRVNSEGAANLASACATRRIRLVHVSTDFVFDGTKEMPYLPNDEPHPLNVYGASKLEGEQRVLKILPEACVVRTSWVHSADTANFVTKIVQRIRAG